MLNEIANLTKNIDAVLISMLIFCSVILIYSVILHFILVKKSPDNKKLSEIASFIEIGANTFLKKEYQYLGVFSIIMSVFFLLFSFDLTVGFILGSVLTGGVGFIGMRVATKMNVRVAEAANAQGLNTALLYAYNGGSIIGLSLVAIGMLAVMLILKIYWINGDFETTLIGLMAGSAGVGLFARVGGGIYTKAADVGADLVGKLELGIPEDDPRNPAVIADNVGDNVGDLAGGSSDVFSSYLIAFVATILLGSFVYQTLQPVLLPIIIVIIGLKMSFLMHLGTQVYLRLKKNAKINPTRVIKLNTLIPSIGFLLSICCLYFLDHGLIFPIEDKHSFLICIIIGTLVGILSEYSTQYYTSSRPIKKIMQASKNGHGSNIIWGLVIGMESVIIPILLLIINIWISYSFLGSYGVALSALAMLSTLASSVGVDAYGPIADNAGGIVEMANLSSEAREVTDQLDSIGNTTAATGKGFAIGSTALSAIALLFFILQKYSEDVIVPINNIFVMGGLWIGTLLPFIFSSLTMRAVGEAANFMVQEVRFQFKNIKGLMEGTSNPDYSRCVSISTHTALNKMLLPGISTTLIPFLIMFFIPWITNHGHQNALFIMIGIVSGSLLSGTVLAFFMSNTGGAWDNAKKSIEAGKLEGEKKGSDAHKASVTGDTVGDPFKDTSGPSLNILIKVLITMLAVTIVLTY